MAISFIRIDDRIIHGQTVTRWANEYPCTGLIGVNDAAAGNKLLVSAFKGASSKKTFVWNKEHFKKNADKVLKILKQISNDGKLVIVVTHSNKVKKYSSRVITIEDGLIKNDETLKNVKNVKKRNKSLK